MTPLGRPECCSPCFLEQEASKLGKDAYASPEREFVGVADGNEVTVPPNLTTELPPVFLDSDLSNRRQS
jgi:hypothetical protein